MTDLQPAIDILEQERAGLAAHMAEASRHNALSAVRQRTGIHQLNQRRLDAYTAALEILRRADASESPPPSPLRRGGQGGEAP